MKTRKFNIFARMIALTMVLSVGTSTLFAQSTSLVKQVDTNVSEYTYEGEIYHKTIEESELETKVTITSNKRTIISIYNKKNSVISTYINAPNTKSISGKPAYIINLDLANEDSSNPDTYAVLNSYISKYTSSKHYEYENNCHALHYDSDSVATPYNPGSTIIDLSKDFRKNIMNVDTYTNKTALAGLGMLPGVGQLQSIISVIVSLSPDGDFSFSDGLDLFVASVSVIPGLGSFMGAASVATNAALVATNNYNAGNNFRAVKKRV